MVETSTPEATLFAFAATGEGPAAVAAVSTKW
jgi:hypothetical protein